MPSNPSRRAELADAGLRVLAASGARGLTHRAVDAEAGVPTGTASNYFRTRDALLAALGERIFERLTPAPERLDPLATEEPSVALVAAYVRDVVERVLGAPELTLALLELRLEATRRPPLAESLGRTLSVGYQADVAFHVSRGLPGGAREVELLHYAIDGLVLDRLTASIGAPGRRASVDEIVTDLVHRLVP
ncbi:TetR/AcrR family transcriptional regulator [Iamia sp. SCSIO 61187]|uniref:TetR/AcrR family transcriptional regulator n=1 Tax=Iamia sp. SCSIO 61187 TaxID=2722752 RepID=UPI001C628430|nr:TetR/AcrR family transcriptional regulator [Iamia sp. SCSIO 61187]QYG95066.1 TetR/AcrR family transcriptional regulator [Iamia sp. SCSIO 61187]